MNNLFEAFKKLDLLEEEVFDVSDDGIEKLKTFLDTEDDKDTEIEVIDTEAETEEDLEDSYVGKVILDCCVCHTKIYKDKKDVIISEDGELVNIDEECPFCFSTDGYKIVGQVAEFDSDETEEEKETEVEVKETEKIEESCKKSLKENWKTDDIIKDLADRAVLDIKEAKKSGIEDKNLDFAESVRVAIDDGLIYTDDIVELGKHYGVIEDSKVLDDMYDYLFEDVYDEVARILGTKDESVKRTVKTNHCKNGKCKKQIKEDLSYGELVDIADKWEEFKKKTGRRDAGDAMEFIETTYKDVYDTEERESIFGYISAIEERETEKEECLKEDFKDVSITTDKEHMEMTSDENGKVTITTEPVVEEHKEEAEVVAPVSDKDIEEIERNSEEENAEETEVQIDDFSEKEFDELGEKYFKKSYNNVDNYKTTKVEKDNNRIKVEGLIKFTSGKQKKTSFILEALDITKSGKARFVGDNCDICAGRKAFVVTGKIDNNRFISESLNYDYNTKDSKTGKKCRVSGTVRIKK